MENNLNSKEEELKEILRVVDNVYSQVCRNATIAKALQHYLYEDEEFEKNAEYIEDITNMAFILADGLNSIKQAIEPIAVDIMSDT